MLSDIKAETALIRKVIKAVCPELSVRAGKGTVTGWVDIYPTDLQRQRFTLEEKAALARLGIIAHCNIFHLTPRERRDWAARLSTDHGARYQAIRD